MKSFAVKCPVPEVWCLLESVAKKNGYDWSNHIARKHTSHHRGCDFFYMNPNGFEGGGILGEACHPVISIEAAIAELQKPRPKPITIGGRTLSFPGDGSVKLSCGETISAEVCDEIERRRKPKSLYRTLDKLLYRPRTDGGGNGWQVFDERQWINSINSINDHAALPTEEITEAEARQRFPEAFQEAK